MKLAISAVRECFGKGVKYGTPDYMEFHVILRKVEIIDPKYDSENQRQKKNVKIFKSEQKIKLRQFRPGVKAFLMHREELHSVVLTVNIATKNREVLLCKSLLNFLTF